MNIRGVTIIAVAIISIVVGVNWHWRERWDREHPLSAPVAVSSISGGKLTLADGRVVEPAGIARPDDVDAAVYDAFLGALTAQGVEVLRDLGDGRAFLRAEPKFWNGCGTCRRQRGNWAGSYFNVALSEYACAKGYAVGCPDQPNLTQRESWRLRAATAMAADLADRPRFRENEIEFDSSARYFYDWDAVAPVYAGAPPE